MTLMHGFASLPCFCSPSLSPSKTQFKRAELRPPRSVLPAPPPGTRRRRRGLPGAVTAHAREGGTSFRTSVCHSSSSQTGTAPQSSTSLQRFHRPPRCFRFPTCPVFPTFRKPRFAFPRCPALPVSESMDGWHSLRLQPRTVRVKIQ